MPKIVAFPIPYDAVAKFICPHNHKAGWDIHAVNHEAGESFWTVSCRTKGCDYRTTGMWSTGYPTEEIIFEGDE